MLWLHCIACDAKRYFAFVIIASGYVSCLFFYKLSFSCFQEKVHFSRFSLSYLLSLSIGYLINYNFIVSEVISGSVFLTFSEVGTYCVLFSLRNKHLLAPKAP